MSTIPILGRSTGVGAPQVFQQAVVLQERGRLREAERLYEATLKADDRHLGALSRLGLLRLSQGNFVEAEQLFRRAVKIDKKSADAQFNLANALTGLKRLDEAVRRYEKALVLKPSFPEAHNNLGFALQLLGRHEEAFTQYENALALRPEYAEAHNNLGNVLQRLKRFESAIKQYEKALMIYPNYAEAFINLGNARCAVGRNEEAIANFQTALALKPNYAEAYHSLGNALTNLGRPEEAIGHYAKALAIGPDYAEAHLEWGNALVELDRYDEAMVEYDKALAMKPHLIPAVTARAHLLMRTGRDADGAQLFNGLVKRGEHRLDALVALSSVPSLVEVDLLSEVDKMIGAGFEDEAQLEDAGFVRAAALDRAGRYAEAWECLQLANRSIFVNAREELDAETDRQRVTLERLRNHPTMAGETNNNVPILLLILGPSRSGKTTLERLVSALPNVKRGYESPSPVDRALLRTIEANALPMSTLFENLPTALYPFCRSAYAEEVVRLSGSAKVLTNTRPGLVFAADLVAAVFPNVRVLCVKRAIQDTVLRIYQRKYRRGHTYSYNLKTAHDHVVWYHQAIDFLHETFPKLVRIVHYEDMVANPAATLRSVADLCALPMMDAPLSQIAGDKGCAAPYSRFIASEIAAVKTEHLGSFREIGNSA
ncbi:MAG: tetratricopeptide repeat protein [Hyphomicrobiales bacterium]|nr:tetratricopeptide repeat protein [Hyphomicrobiales bacterium]